VVGFRTLANVATRWDRIPAAWRPFLSVLADKAGCLHDDEKHHNSKVCVPNYHIVHMHDNVCGMNVDGVNDCSNMSGIDLSLHAMPRAGAGLRSA
jgi:hypothetical protein